MQKIIKKFNEIVIRTLALLIAGAFTLGCSSNTAQAMKLFAADPTSDPDPMGMMAADNTIRLALLLDTSNSMDGLIDQAKSQLWVIVNELGKARYNGLEPKLEIALYEYGNARLLVKDKYIRQVVPFTHDLDTISQELFALKTNGGDEFCGAVIDSSLKQLKWSSLTNDLELIVIAGNEPFTQGPVDPKKSCALAKEKHVYINTIYCGDALEGIKTGWKIDNELVAGSYMNINQDKKTVFIETPYDKQIVSLNDSLNATYIAYGSLGSYKINSQKEEDANSGNYGDANKVNRTTTKVSSKYKNESWDMVDASEQKEFDIKKYKEEQLPKEMKGMTEAQKLAYIEKKKLEREQIKKRVGELNVEREKYIQEKQLKEDKTARLDQVLIDAIHKQAMDRGFTFI
jgi:hypothetical protein